MRGDEFRRLLESLYRLTGGQRERLKKRLEWTRGGDAVATAIEQRMLSRPYCPKCGSERVVRNGQANGLQRYKCRACAVTFNALSGTPLARLRLREKWFGQAKVLHLGLSVRAAASQLEVHRTTAFRWRHRFLTVPCEIKAIPLTGVAEADETYHLRSYKGQPRRLLAEQSRAPRRRGGSAAKRGLSSEQVPVLVLRDRSKQTADFVLKRADAVGVTTVLRPTLAKDALLCTDGSGALAAAARSLEIEHHAINVSRGERVRGAWHIQNVNAYHSRFKQWMLRFHGVATSYLPNYLGWFRALDRNAQTGAPPTSLLSLAIAA